MNPKDAVGKPFVALVDGQKQNIGQVTRSELKNGSLYLQVRLYTLDELEGWTAAPSS